MCKLNELKNTVRGLSKKNRKSMSASQRSAADKLITDAAVDLIKKFDREIPVYCYVSMPEMEVATDGIIRFAIERGMTVIVPKCVRENVRLEHYAISSRSCLAKGYYGIEEPVPEKCRRVNAPHKGICIVPGLAFDEYGIRMGWGMGFYDRFLESFEGLKIGLCYECCLFSGSLPHDEYDAKMDIVISEKMIRKM